MRRLAVLLFAFAVVVAVPRASAITCDEACDKDAAACVDACEDKFPDAPRDRVGCKLDCAKKRGSCAKKCGGAGSGGDGGGGGSGGS